MAIADVVKFLFNSKPMSVKENLDTSFFHIADVCRLRLRAIRAKFQCSFISRRSSTSTGRIVLVKKIVDFLRKKDEFFEDLRRSVQLYIR